jgi:ABC-2 type transport system permease protein
MAYLLIFFLRDGIHSRRTLWISIIGMVPVACAVFLLFASSFMDVKPHQIYPQFSYLLFLHFLLPLTAVFIGTAIIGDEVEEKTLPFLLTRPVPRWSIVAAKAAAGIITIGIVILVSFTLTYLIMMSRAGSASFIRGLPAFFRSSAALILGLAVYVPLFGFIGGILKKPVLAGLLFTFGWESSIAFFPGNARLLTVVHYLHSLFPAIRQVTPDDMGRTLFGLVLSANKTPFILSVFVLSALSLFFTGLMIMILYFKEYRLDD